MNQLSIQKAKQIFTFFLTTGKTQELTDVYADNPSWVLTSTLI